MRRGNEINIALDQRKIVIENHFRNPPFAVAENSVKVKTPRQKDRDKQLALKC
jgi:hypothetical protein